MCSYPLLVGTPSTYDASVAVPVNGSDHLGKKYLLNQFFPLWYTKLSYICTFLFKLEFNSNSNSMHVHSQILAKTCFIYGLKKGSVAIKQLRVTMTKLTSDVTVTVWLGGKIAVKFYYLLRQFLLALVYIFLLHVLNIPM